MRLCYVLLSPTFGMHQYTADLANRMSAAGHHVTLVTTSLFPKDRYAPEINFQTPIATSNTGFSREGFNFRQQDSIIRSAIKAAPDILHFTGPHLWNVTLVRRLRRSGYPVIHTIHDLDPHTGMRMGSLLRIWNNQIIKAADHILVHGQVYYRRLLQHGIPAQKVTYTPLLHLFVSHEQATYLSGLDGDGFHITYEPFVLFFGRLAKYKGINHLLLAFEQLESEGSPPFRLVLAGPGDLSSIWSRDMPSSAITYNRLIEDAEAVDLFCRCSLVVLPYTDATQSALVAAAYFFKKPVIVTDSGALAEYVIDHETGFIVEPGRSAQLAQIISEASRAPNLLQKMGLSGRSWYENKRSEEFKTLNALYASLKHA